MPRGSPMPYLSEMLDQPVRDASGREVGRLRDLIVPVDVDYPAVAAIVLARDGDDLAIPWSQVHLEDSQLRLAVDADQVTPYPGSDQDLYLRRQVLDRQIIDLNGTRVVRVNDLHLARTNGQMRLVSVDISTPGLLRRLGIERPISSVLRRFRLSLPQRMIAWQDIDPLEFGASGVRLRVPQEDLARLHPADIAAIVSQLDQYHAEQAISGLDAETAAEAISEVDPELQVAVLEAMDQERAADILEEMDPDDAADILDEMDEARAETLLGLMQPEEAEEVRELLGYPENSAGGIMTTEYVTIPPDITVAQAIERVRQEAGEVGDVYYLYVVDDEDRLLGVLSLKELVLAEPNALVRDVMHRDVLKVDLYSPQERVAQMVAKYNLLAIPVVDENNVMRGIVTVDDAIDILLPTAWKKRLPRIFH